jgi:exosortase/archaeosortase family protein
VLSLLYGFSLSQVYQKIVVQATVAYAVIAHAVIQLFDGESSREGATLRSGVDAIITVQPFCTAFDCAWFLIAAIVAFPAPLTKKFIGVAVGVPILLFLNVLRISSLYGTGVGFPENFTFMHEQVWTFLLNFSVVCLVVVWMMWVTRLKRHES